LWARINWTREGETEAHVVEIFSNNGAVYWDEFEVEEKDIAIKEHSG